MSPTAWKMTAWRISDAALWRGFTAGEDAMKNKVDSGRFIQGNISDKQMNGEGRILGKAKMRFKKKLDMPREE